MLLDEPTTTTAAVLAVVTAYFPALASSSPDAVAVVAQVEAARHGLHERRRHLSSRDRVGIVAMYAERRPINEIRRRYSVTATTIYRIIHAEGIPVHCPGRAAVLRKAALARHTRTRTGGCP